MEACVIRFGVLALMLLFTQQAVAQSSVPATPGPPFTVPGILSSDGTKFVPPQVGGIGMPVTGSVTVTGTPTVSAAVTSLPALPAGTNAIGAVTTTAAALAAVSSTAAESSHILKSSAGTIYSLTVTTGATAGYVLVFNATSAPSDGSVTPSDCVSVSAGASTGITWSPPLSLSTGITVVFSSSGCFTKTASATAFFSGQVQ